MDTLDLLGLMDDEAAYETALAQDNEPCIDCGGTNTSTGTCEDCERREREEDEEDYRYRNFYRCSCGEEWEDAWSCACNDRCPNCNTEIEPYKSEEVDADDI